MYSVHVDAATAGVGQYTAFILKAFNEEMSEDEQNVMKKVKAGEISSMPVLSTTIDG